MELFDRSFAEMSALEVHDVLKLRVDVFVVEQACAYPEIDGRDVEPRTRHLWFAHQAGIGAYLRVLDGGDVRRIGRVVTSAPARGNALARRLVDHAVAATAGPWALHAQSHLEGWYEGSGFEVDGPEFVEDGIPHVPMRRT